LSEKKLTFWSLNFEKFHLSELFTEFTVTCKKAKRRGFFCFPKDEKADLWKDKRETTLVRKKQRKEAFAIMKEQEETKTQTPEKHKALENKSKDGKGKMESKKPMA